ncbi:MAG: hypothetical protein AAGU76_06640 [Sedimentibacter sp.]|uniref:hypothetical protein n=1 Tax=Sedimentibacter sp. TaxID=1960295 RepID=UPI003158E39B
MESKTQRTSRVSVGMGGTLIITIFVVLSLTIFATLSFTTAHSDLKLARKAEKMTSDYYLTAAGAEEQLSDIWTAMNSAAKGSNSRESYYDNLSLSLFAMKNVDCSFEEGVFRIYYESSGGRNQKICVTLNALYDTSGKPSYEIESWNLANIELPVYEEENYDLWEGIDKQ